MPGSQHALHVGLTLTDGHFNVGKPTQGRTGQRCELKARGKQCVQELTGARRTGPKPSKQDSQRARPRVGLCTPRSSTQAREPGPHTAQRAAQTGALLGTEAAAAVRCASQQLLLRRWQWGSWHCPIMGDRSRHSLGGEVLGKIARSNAELNRMCTSPVASAEFTMPRWLFKSGQPRTDCQTNCHLRAPGALSRPTNRLPGVRDRWALQCWGPGHQSCKQEKARRPGRPCSAARAAHLRLERSAGTGAEVREASVSVFVWRGAVLGAGPSLHTELHSQSFLLCCETTSW